MADENPHPSLLQLSQALAAGCHLIRVYTAVFKSQRSRCVDAQDRDFRVGIKRLQIVTDISSIIPQRRKPALEDII